MVTPPLFLGGIFNYGDPLFNQPVYLWGFLFGTIITVLCWITWRYVIWARYTPVHGIYYAFKAHSQAAFIFNKGLISELLSERHAKCIFDYSKWSYEGLSKIQAFLFNYTSVFLDIDLAHALIYKFGGKNMDVQIAKKLQGNIWESESSITTGGIHCDMILDIEDWSVPESPQHAIVESIATQWNEANPNDQVHAYPLFQKMLLPSKDGGVHRPPKLNCPPGLCATAIIPWVRIDAAFPIVVANNEAAGAIRELAKELEDADAQEFSKYYFPILGGCFGFAILLLLIRIAMLRIKF